MITDSIKKILGEDLTKQVEGALKGKGKDGKDIDLCVGNDGSFVPAEKYNAAVDQKKQADKVLESVSSQIKALGGSGDVAKLSDDVAAFKTANDNLIYQGLRGFLYKIKELLILYQ